MRGDLFGFDGTGWRPVKRGFDVRLYGAVGNGTTSDTVAFQAAIDAAIAAHGTLVIPDAPTNWVIDDTLTIQAAANGSQAFMNIEMNGIYSSIKWTGANNKPIFKSYGWKYGHVQGVRATLYGNVTGVILFDLDHDTTRNSTGGLSFRDCQITSDAVGVKTSCMGWRAGHSAGTNVEFSFIHFDTCFVHFSIGTDVTCTGWGMEENNGLVVTWTNSGSTGCNEGWTGNQSSGAGGTPGSSSWTLIGCGASGNITDFVFRGSSYTIVGGRFELGRMFMNAPFSTAGRSVLLQGVAIAEYNPNEAGGERLFDLQSGSFLFDSVELVRPSGVAHGAATIQLNNGSVNTALHIRGGLWHAADPFVFAANGTLNRVTIQDAMVITSAGVVTGMFKNTSRAYTVTALTYSASIATNASIGERFTIAATNGTAFTISTPTNPATGETLTYDIKNSSGGAHGVITWGAGFLNGGAGTVGAGAFAGIANGKRRTISFYYDGTNWIEQYRTADQ